MAKIVSPFLADTLDYTDGNGNTIKSFAYTVNVPKFGEFMRQNLSQMQDAEKAKDMNTLVSAYTGIVRSIFGNAADELLEFYTLDGALEKEAFVSDMADILTRIIIPKVQTYQKGRVSALKALKDG